MGTLSVNIITVNFLFKSSDTNHITKIWEIFVCQVSDGRKQSDLIAELKTALLENGNKHPFSHAKT